MNNNKGYKEWYTYDNNSKLIYTKNSNNYEEWYTYANNSSTTRSFIRLIA